MTSMKGFRIPRFEMSRVFKNHTVSRAPKNQTGLGPRRIEDLSKLTGAFCGVVFPNSYGLRVQGMKGCFLGLQGPGSKGAKGSLGDCRSQGFKAPRA